MGLLKPLPRFDKNPCRATLVLRIRAPQNVDDAANMNQLSIRDLEMSGKRVFIRVDFNVPMDGAEIEDDTRIRETLPTLRLAIDRGARLVLASHLGRPKGKVDPKYSLAPVAARLQELLRGKPVAFASDSFGPEA